MLTLLLFFFYVICNILIEYLKTTAALQPKPVNPQPQPPPPVQPQENLNNPDNDNAQQDAPDAAQAEPLNHYDQNGGEIPIAT